MGQASSVQREPSMEEILASIRKIIEDSDTVRHPAAEAELPDVVKVVGGVNSKLDAGDSPAQTYDVQENDVSLADEQTQPAALLTDEASAPHAVKTPEMKQPLQESQIDEVGLAQFENVLDDTPVEASVLQNADETMTEATIQHQEADADHDRLSTLVSETSAKRIHAAFGELSQAYTASRERSLDAMAKEMLQPMLKEWLDSNLPALVEKLVREEIQRIADDTQS